MIPSTCPLSDIQEIRNHKYKFCQYDRSVECRHKDFETCPVYIAHESKLEGEVDGI